jgi:hypothetical protein
MYTTFHLLLCKAVKSKREITGLTYLLLVTDLVNYPTLH